MTITHVVVGTKITAEHQNQIINQVNQHTEEIQELQEGSGGTPLNPVVDWFSGEGPPPAVVPGAGPGDMYIDTATGALYQLH